MDGWMPVGVHYITVTKSTTGSTIGTITVHQYHHHQTIVYHNCTSFTIAKTIVITFAKVRLGWSLSPVKVFIPFKQEEIQLYQCVSKKT